MADLEFDVAVIGTGTSAYKAAHPLAKAGRRVASADRSKPFVIGALRAEAPPAVQTAKAAARPKTEQERVELEALAANGGNPVIDDKTLKAVRGAR